MKPEISIALTVYNGGRYLYEQLQSIKGQELLPAEIVIVDDVSTDDSEQIIKNFDFGTITCRYYKNEHNLGPVANFKKAIGLCTGNFIALCDQDDIWMPHKLKILYGAISKKSQSKPVVVFSDVALINHDGTFLAQSIYKDVWKIKPYKYTLGLLLIENVIIGCTSVINRAMQQEVSKMPVAGIMMHDYWITLVAKNIGETSFVDEPLILYRTHDQSVTDKVPVKGLFSKINREFSIRQNYLHDNIAQAKQFKAVYYNEMAAASQKTLDRFINLENKPFFIKRLYAKALKVYINK